MQRKRRRYTDWWIPALLGVLVTFLISSTAFGLTHGWTSAIPCDMGYDVNSCNMNDHTLEADENFCTDAEKAIISAQSGTNTGDQDLSGLMPKSGGVFTGPITLADAVNALNSGGYPIQMESGETDSGTAVGYSFDTTNTLTGSSHRLFTFKNNGTERIFYGEDGGVEGLYLATRMAIGDALLSTLNPINVDVTFDPAPISETPVFKMVARVNGTNVIPNPVAIYGQMILDDHGFSAYPNVFTAFVQHNSNDSIYQSTGFRSTYMGTAAATGAVNVIQGLWCSSPSYQAASTPRPTSAYGIQIDNQGGSVGTSTTGIAVGLLIAKQINATTNRGIWLYSDGIGSDIVFGTGADDKIYHDGTNLRLDVANGVFIPTDKRQYYRDTDIGIYSQADSFLDIYADGLVRIGNSSAGAPTTYLSIEPDGGVVSVGEGSGLAFAEIHNHDSSALQSVGTGTTYTKLTNFTDNGLSNNATPDATNDKITITKTGKYLVNCSFSFTCDTNNVEWSVAPFLNAVEQDHIHFIRKIGTANDVGSASLTGIIDVTTASWDLDVRARHNNGGSIDITVEYANCNITQLGGT